MQELRLSDLFRHLPLTAGLQLFQSFFRDFLNRIGGYAAHLHIVDAEGVDSEGLQIGEGTTDFGMVAEMLNKECPKASFIPEIWQGHKNNGEGFWHALETLEQWF